MKYIFLANEYDLVVDDTFELFYRGVICLNNPYEYYILIRCEKGHPYSRYYTFTPKSQDVGDYPLTITLLDNNHQIIDEGTTILHVQQPHQPKERLNVLCIGDSLTFNGVWPSEGYRRFAKTGGYPLGNGFHDSLYMIGSCKKEIDGSIVGYEGYGSWTWKSFCTNDLVSTKSPIWVRVQNHHLDENDQHSTWTSGNLEWVLESIEKKRLKFKRGNNNYSPSPLVEKEFIHLYGGIHHDSIFIDDFTFEIGNPFWHNETKEIDFKEYAKKQEVDKIDLVYILLTWNGLYRPYDQEFNRHLDYAKILIHKIHQAFPNAHITLLGIPICSVNGGIAANYGANGPYSDTFGTISTAFNYNKCLENFVNQEEYKTYCRYVDCKAQFDSEYNMPSIEKPVNSRSKITERIGTNGVHPNMEGYLQLGDAFYRALVKDINDLEK
jgi:hypothetical protein